MIRSLSFSIALIVSSSVLAEPPPVEKPSPNKPGEPLLKTWSKEKAASFLDGVAVNWTRERNCGTCHTNYPYLIARPLLSPVGRPGNEWREVRSFFENRAANWDTAKPRWDAEVVATASCLAVSDAMTTNKLNPITKKALDRMWTLQGKDGGWTWLKCDWPPFEHDDYFGALYAAVGVGYAPGGYKDSASAKGGLAKLKQYLKQTPAPDLHHKTWLLWASARLDGLLLDDERQSLIRELLSKQHSDGGWCLPLLGAWKRRDGSPNDANAESDGYATGLVVFVLRQAGLAKDQEAIKKGAEWLRKHQTESGRWFTRSLNNDKAHYITNAGTAFAVLALRECE
jgi:squalene-hopene/tetraprenyl-beta-curcumene cyclase